MSILTAQQLEENEQYDKAYEEYKGVQNPNIDILERLAHLALILKKNDEAVEYYNSILEKDPQNILAYEQLMDLYADSERYKYYISRGNKHVIEQEFMHAISDFKKALSKAETDEEINSTRFVLASLLEKTGKNNEAIDEYLRILESPAKNEESFLNLAAIYIKEDSISSAIETLTRAIDAGYDSNVVKEELAQLYLRNNQQDKARNFTTDSLTKIRSYLDEEENEKAFELLEQVKDTYKKNPKYLSLLAQYYYNKSDWDNALATVTEFEKFDKTSPLTNQMRALIYEEKGEDYLAHINWAKYNLRRGNKDVALNEYYMAIKIKDDDAETILNIAELLEDMKDKTQAGEFWGMLVKLEPTNRRALEKLADFKESIGDYQGQVDALEGLVKASNKNLLNVKKLAQAYEKVKDNENALKCYQYYVDHSPVNDDYSFAKARVEKLSTQPRGEASSQEEGLLDKIMRLFSK